jgi:hypothetical protein
MGKVIGFLLAAWSFIVTLTRMAGDADFVIERAQKPQEGIGGMIYTAAQWLLNPPPWAPLAAILVGMLLIWWGLNRKSANPQRESEPRDDAKGQSQRALPRMATGTGVVWSFPDNIDALFDFRAGPDGELLIAGYRIVGINMSDQAITPKEAYLIPVQTNWIDNGPKRTGPKIELMFKTRNGLLRAKDARIPAGPGVEVILVHEFPAPITPDEYLEKYGGIEFNWEGPDYYGHAYTLGAVREQIELKQEKWDAQRLRPAEVRRRTE